MANQIFKDIDLNFYRHPGTGDIMRVFDLAAVKTAMINIIGGKPFEKPFDEFYGSGIRRLLFSQYTPMLPVVAKRMIKEKIELYDPRIKVLNVEVNKNDPDRRLMDSHQLVIDIEYTVTGFGTQSLRFEMERLR